MSAVAFLSGDLLFASRVRAAAEAAGLNFHFGGSLPNADNVQWVIVDLATRSGIVDSLMQQCAQQCPQASVIAFGPHVQVPRLEKARQAGIPIVMTRGQFDRELPSLFES